MSMLAGTAFAFAVATSTSSPPAVPATAVAISVVVREKTVASFAIQVLLRGSDACKGGLLGRFRGLPTGAFMETAHAAQPILHQGHDLRVGIRLVEKQDQVRPEFDARTCRRQRTVDVTGPNPDHRRAKHLERLGRAGCRR